MAGISPFKSRPPYGKRPWESAIRKNDRIRAREVRVIGPEGKQLGILPISRALQLARDCGLDLIEISATANPPVCKIADFGKYQYDEGKKQKHQKDTSPKLKEVKFRLNIEAHDYETKIKHGIAFLQEGDKVKVALSFRTREMERQGFGMDIVRRAINDLADYGTPDGEPRLVGREISVVFSPKISAAKRKQITASEHKADNPQPDLPPKH